MEKREPFLPPELCGKSIIKEPNCLIRFGRKNCIELACFELLFRFRLLERFEVKLGERLLK
jgi:hypothetical protein